VLLAPSLLFSQDIHFSQFDMAPMNLNPALAGQFDGDYRFIGNQRTQWRSVTIPYATIGGSVDSRNFNQIAGLGTGLSIYQDKAGDSRLSTLQVNLAGSFLFNVSQDSIQSFSAGVQLGFTSRKIDYSDLQYDNQWNGFAYDPNLDPNEQYTRDARTYANVNVGMAYFYQPERRKSFTAGLSIFNLNTPKQSFYDDSSIKLDPRVVIHVSGEIPVSENINVLPAFEFQLQGKFVETIIGGSGKYVMLDEAGLYRTIFGGFYYRAKDAGYIVAGMDYDAWRVGLSYDINLSNLKPASNGKGGFEISVVYILKKFRAMEINRRICPDFL
jgi:type IX secretion system PorP/SprF family membrane protein